MVGEVVHQDDELVAAPARHRVARPHRGLQALRDHAQHLVADVVAEAVVDALEAVEVDEQQRHQAAAADRPGECLLQAVEQQGAVGQAGEEVVGGFVLQAGGDREGLGDIAEHDDAALAALADRRRGHAQGASAAVRGAPAQRLGQAHALAAREGIARRVARGPGLGAEVLQQLAERAPARGGAAEPGQAFGHRVDHGDAALLVDGDHRVGDRAQRGVGVVAGADQRAMRALQPAQQPQQAAEGEREPAGGGGNPQLQAAEGEHARGGRQRGERAEHEGGAAPAATDERGGGNGERQRQPGGEQRGGAAVDGAAAQRLVGARVELHRRHRLAGERGGGRQAAVHAGRGDADEDRAAGQLAYAGGLFEQAVVGERGWLCVRIRHRQQQFALAHPGQARADVAQAALAAGVDAASARIARTRGHLQGGEREGAPVRVFGAGAGEGPAREPVGVERDIDVAQRRGLGREDRVGQ